MTEKWGEVEIHKDKERGGDNSNTVFEARKLGGWGALWTSKTGDRAS